MDKLLGQHDTVYHSVKFVYALNYWHTDSVIIA